MELYGGIDHVMLKGLEDIVSVSLVCTCTHYTCKLDLGEKGRGQGGIERFNNNSNKFWGKWEF